MSLRVAAVAAALVLTACGPQVLEVQMGALNDSGQSGKATLTQEGEDVSVVMDIQPGSDTGAQTAHIHEGNCPGLGTIVFALEPLKGGKSTTVLPKVQLDALRQRAINVHNSATPSTYVSCGEIK